MNIGIKGIGRSGSTLLYYVFSDLEKEGIISIGSGLNRIHNLRVEGEITFFIYRDPRDVILSRIRTNISSQNEEFKGFDTLPSFLILDELKPNSILSTHLKDGYILYQSPSVVNVQYEKFHNNFDYLFDLVEDNCNVTINPSIRQKIKNTRSKQSMKIKQSQFKNFSEWDKEHIHGDHIFEGDNKWEQNIPLNILKKVENVLEVYIEGFGYEKTT